MANFIMQPWHLLLAILAGAVHDEQQKVIEYLRTENQVLKEKLGKKRIILNADQRRRLAVKGKVLGRKTLSAIASIVTPDTILRWHRPSTQPGFTICAGRRIYRQFRRVVLGRGWNSRFAVVGFGTKG
jgi:hypothetical protein